MRSPTTKSHALHLEPMGTDNLFIAGLMTGRNELTELVERLLPGAEILDYDTRPVQRP